LPALWVSGPVDGSTTSSSLRREKEGEKEAGEEED